MGNLGILLGLVGTFVLTLLVKWVFPHFWGVCMVGYPDVVKIAAWTLFFGAPIGFILAAKGINRKVFGLVWAVVWWWPIVVLLMFGHRILPPFFMRDYDPAARFCVALVGWMFGGWCIMKLWDVRGGFDFSWLAHFLDKVFGRK